MESRYIGEESEVRQPICNSCKKHGFGDECSKYGKIPSSVWDTNKCEFYELKK